MRLQRALARAGVASRRAAEEIIAAGRVTVNGTVATLGQSVDPAKDRIAVDGRAIAAPAKPVWLMLHKPSGTITSRRDPRGRPTVFTLVTDAPGLTYVGRLDYLTEGLLLFTTDGEMAHRLTHPSSEVERTYVATVQGNAKAAARALRNGVELEDGLAVARDVDVAPAGRGKFLMTITLAEGRNREVRRMCDAAGVEVEHLVRTRFGPLELGTLPRGKSRPLTAKELQRLSAL